MGESTPAADPPAPADLLPPPGRRAVALWYAGTALLAALLIAAGFRLDRVNLREPLAYDGDVLLIMPMVKATVEGGTHWRIERMGYPGVYELYDFPVIDHLHFAIVWLFGRVVRDWVLVYNLYFLLTWPLTAVTTLWAFRRFGLSYPFAAAGAVLFAFLPYHYARGESHYFLAAYWLVPLSWLPAFAVCKGNLPFFRRRPDGAGYDRELVSKAAGWQVLLAAATASAGAYYAFFACVIYMVAGLYGWAAHRTWRALASATLVAALVAAFGMVNHLPAVVNNLKYGRTAATERTPEEGETYAMKIAQLVLPIDQHNIAAFGRVKASYTSVFPLNNENGASSLGAVGAAGLLGLGAVLIFPNRLGWPYRPLAALSVVIVLFATIGGLGSLFNLLVFDQIRCHNRFSVYLAVPCLLAPLWALDRFLLTRPGRARDFHATAAVALTALGIADQTPAAWFTPVVTEDVEKAAAHFRADRDFFARVEAAAPGARVFCMPYLPFPEVPLLHELDTYDHARGYLHTDTLVIGAQAIKFRETDEWLRSVAYGPADAVVRRVVARGFDGVLVDGRGFVVQEEANRLVRQLREAARVPLPEVIHADGRQVFLDLRPYRAWLRAQNPAYLEREEARERDFVAMCWVRGFWNPAPHLEPGNTRYGYRTGTIQIVNPTDRVRTYDLGVTFHPTAEAEFGLDLSGGTIAWTDQPGGPYPWVDSFTFRTDVRRTYRLDIPPGRHTVRVRCTTPPNHYIGNTRPICYHVLDVAFFEVAR